MNCNSCPDREICYQAGPVRENIRDYYKLKEAYLRTLRCRKQRFG